MTTITSIYVQGADSAVFKLQSTDGTITMLDTWASSPSDRNVVSAAIKLSGGVDYCILNDDGFSSGAPSSALKEVLITLGLDNTLEIVRRFDAAAGISALQSLQELGKLNTDGFVLWPRLEAEILQAHKGCSPLLMALLQGVLDLHFTDRSDRPLFGLKVRSLSGDELWRWCDV